MVECSASAPRAGSATDEPKDLEFAKFAAGPHRCLSLRSMDDIILLSAVLLLDIDRGAVTLQCDARFDCGFTYHVLKRFPYTPISRGRCSTHFDVAMSWYSVLINLFRAGFVPS